MSEDTSNITRLLKEWKEGDDEAFQRLLPFVYDELRRRASGYLKRESSGHTLQTTALLNEAYIKLIDKESIDWQSRSHFYAVAATAMRRILVDHARNKKRKKRGGAQADLPLDEAVYISGKGRSVDLIALDEALDVLAEFDPRQSKIVEYRYFAGLTVDETAQVMDISDSTVRREWKIAKAWLYSRIK